MKIKLNKINFLKFLILFAFICSIIISENVLNQNDKLVEEDKFFYHKMIKADPMRYLSHGAEIKEQVENGKNFFLAGREHYTKYLPPRLAAIYYIILDKNLFNNFEEKKVNLNIHFEYLIFQCLFYFLSVYFLFTSIKNKFNYKTTFIIIFLLCFEPTILQYNFSFWSESFFFSLQIVILAIFLKKNQNAKNLFLLGLFVGILSLQRQIAIFYIIPIIFYYMYFVKKHISTLFLMTGYLIIQLFLGYINFLKTDNFHILTADSKIEMHRSFVTPVISKKLGISKTQFNFDEGIVVKEWLEKERINYRNKNKFLSKQNNFVDWMDYRREIILDSDKIRFDNFIKNRTYDYIFKNLPDFISQYFYKSLHTVVLNPFHISSDYKFKSGEIYYESNSHKKYIPHRIIYTFAIYIVSLIGFIILYKKKEYNLIAILIISIVYFFGLVGWSGNTRYFVPSLIYILIFFSFGLNSIIDKLFNKNLLKH